jgi:hypothetical protein
MAVLEDGCARVHADLEDRESSQIPKSTAAHSTRPKEHAFSSGSRLRHPHTKQAGAEREVCNERGPLNTA